MSPESAAVSSPPRLTQDLAGILQRQSVHRWQRPRCIHPLRGLTLLRPAGHDLTRDILGIFGVESRFNELIASGLAPLTWHFTFVVPTGFEPVSPP